MKTVVVAIFREVGREIEEMEEEEREFLRFSRRCCFVSLRGGRTREGG